MERRRIWVEGAMARRDRKYRSSKIRTVHGCTLDGRSAHLIETRRAMMKKRLSQRYVSLAARRAVSRSKDEAGVGHILR